jgi:hypothetical protein
VSISLVLYHSHSRFPFRKTDGFLYLLRPQSLTQSLVMNDKGLVSRWRCGYRLLVASMGISQPLSGRVVGAEKDVGAMDVDPDAATPFRTASAAQIHVQPPVSQSALVPATTALQPSSRPDHATAPAPPSSPSKTAAPPALAPLSAPAPTSIDIPRSSPRQLRGELEVAILPDFSHPNKVYLGRRWVLRCKLGG